MYVQYIEQAVVASPALSHSQTQSSAQPFPTQPQRSAILNTAPALSHSQTQHQHSAIPNSHTGADFEAVSFWSLWIINLSYNLARQCCYVLPSTVPWSSSKQFNPHTYTPHTPSHTRTHTRWGVGGGGGGGNLLLIWPFSHWAGRKSPAYLSLAGAGRRKCCCGRVRLVSVCVRYACLRQFVCAWGGGGLGLDGD